VPTRQPIRHELGAAAAVGASKDAMAGFSRACRLVGMSELSLDLARRRNGLPASRLRGSLPKRVLTSGWTWVFVSALVIYTGALLWLFGDVARNLTTLSSQVTASLVRASLREAAWLALPTVLVWSVIFPLADRYRPQRLLVWFLSLGWGAAMAVFFSYYINSWAATHLGIEGTGDPSAGARAAIFVAPFVEEACKATVVFLIAIFARYRLFTRTSVIAIAGLSAAGFAFTENIVYYVRGIIYAALTPEAGDAKDAVAQMVALRGGWLAFGHPLFTTMTGIGIAVALHTRSKVVRVLAPLAGYATAAFLHMVFNSQATFADENDYGVIYFGVAVPVVLAAVAYVVRQILADGRRIESRLDDYVRLGWLLTSDPVVIARLRLRLWALLVAITWGGTRFVATLRLHNRLTELAFLRDGQVRGIYDRGAVSRERTLVEQAKALRPAAISDPRGMKLNLPRWRRRKPVKYGVPNYPGPTGSSGNWPVAVGSPQIDPGYPAVDPQWGPPRK
jgi:protease PrsW